MKKIIIIDDNEDIVSDCEHILTLANYQVYTARNGKAGAEQAIAHHPHLIICDIEMPVLDGFGVFHLLQNYSYLQTVPFIFLTEKASHPEMRKVMDLGADDYLLKPIDSSELLNSVERRFKKTEQSAFADGGSHEDFEENSSTSSAGSLISFVEDRNIEIYGPKQIIFMEGKRPTKLFYVLKGKVKTFLRNNDGKELVCDLYGEGEFFGYIAILEGTNYKEFAATLDYTEVAVVPVEEFRELIYHDHEIAKQFIKMLAGNVSEKEQHLIKIAYNSLRRKVAEALITLHQKYKSILGEPFSIKLSRDSLASISGTATESLIRTLSDFKNEKIIEIGVNGTIKIIDLAKLEKTLN